MKIKATFVPSSSTSTSAALSGVMRRPESTEPAEISDDSDVSMFSCETTKHVQHVVKGSLTGAGEKKMPYLDNGGRLDVAGVERRRDGGHRAGVGAAVAVRDPEEAGTARQRHGRRLRRGVERRRRRPLLDGRLHLRRRSHVTSSMTE